MKKLLKLILLAICTLYLGNVSAHHSRSNFHLDKIDTFEATVTRFHYRNPHSLVYVEKINDAGEAEEWVIECGSIPNLKQMKMSAGAVRPGDKITVSGNRDRDPDRHHMFLVSITKQDGTRYAFDDVFQYGKDVRAAAADKPGSADFTGVWDLEISRAAVLGGGGTPSYPVTQRGQALMAKYDPNENPSFSCQKGTVPGMVGTPYAVTVERDAKAIYFHHEFPEQTRIVHLNQDSHPADAPASILGHSIGHFDGDTLVVDTVNFLPKKWGVGSGLDSSAQKHVIERYSLADEGRMMKVAVTAIDPVYLTEPIQRNFERRYTPDYEVTEYVECDIEAARAHIQ